MVIDITIHDTQLTEALGQLRARVSDLSPAMADIAETLQTITDEAFSAERSPDGTPWADLAPATWRHKRSPHKLFESGTLRGSLYADSSAHEARVGVHASAHGFPYGIVHQFGSAKTPARPFLPLTDTGNLSQGVPEQILDILEAYLDIG